MKPFVFMAREEKQKAQMEGQAKRATMEKLAASRYEVDMVAQRNLVEEQKESKQCKIDRVDVPDVHRLQSKAMTTPCMLIELTCLQRTAQGRLCPFNWHVWSTVISSSRQE